MPWVKASDVMPAEDEPVLIYDERNRRMESGRYVKGRWYVEDVRSGRLRETARVTHWAPLLDSETNDDSDDD